MKICIDPGHGGSDPGAVGNGLREKDITLAIALAVARLLRAAGQTVIMTRETDRFIDLTPERAPTADISVSIHVNAGGGQGLETWVSMFNEPEESRRLGQAIQSAVLKQIPFKDRGLKTKANSTGNADYLYMIRKPLAVSVLVECGFIDSAVDVGILQSPDNLNKIAAGIAAGILEYLGEEGDAMAERWKLDIIAEAKQAGLIAVDHDPDEPATKWFVLGIALAVLKKALKG